MHSTIRAALVNAAYGAIARGVRLPNSRMVSDFRQWGCLMDLLGQLRINVFLDVGANRGFFSKHLRMSGFPGHIFSFEPIAEDYEKIRVLSATDGKWQTFNCALGSEDGQREFNVNVVGNGETVLSSFLPLKDQPPGSSVRTVEIRRLDGLLPKLTVDVADPRVFLKMDTQGFDGAVVDGAASCIDTILGLQSELSVIPLYEGMKSYTESLAHYESLGFRLRDLFVVNRLPNGGVLEYDCLMAKDQA